MMWRELSSCGDMRVRIDFLRLRRSKGKPGNRQMIEKSAPPRSDPELHKKRHPACAVCPKALVLFSLGGNFRGDVCFPIYGLAAFTTGSAPKEKQRQRAVIEDTSNTAGCWKGGYAAAGYGQTVRVFLR